MEYQKIINLLNDTANLPSKFITRNSDESRENYENNNTKFKTSMIRSNLCDY